MTRWPGLGVAAALAVVGLLLALPQPARDRPAPAGPSTLAARWPAARVVDVPATLPDGTGYTPGLIVSAAVSVGYATRPGSQHTTLGVLADRRLRPLQELTPGIGDGVAALTADAGRVYWLRGTIGSSSLWSADLSGGPVRQLVPDAGAVATHSSQYDLQIADGQLHWTVAVPGATELRSVPLNGGTVHTSTVTGTYAPVTWPWLAGPGTLLNPVTGERLATPTGGQVACSRVWCRVTNGADAVVLQRPGGDGRRIVPASTGTPALADVALLDRFVVLTAPTSSNPDSAVFRLVLYDLATGRPVTAAPAVGQVVGASPWLCWATGDQETLAWHALDLRTLTP
jgi:hypothetical protein